MPSIREIRRKIKSVRQTQQVTKAMKMIAASRLKRAQTSLLASRPYAKKVTELVSSLKDRLAGEGTLPPPLLAPRPQAKDRLIILMSSDKGLCGSYNVALLRRTLQELDIAKTGGGRTVFFVIGKKGRDFLASHGFSMEKEFVNFLRRPSFAQAEILAKEAVDYYLNHSNISRVDVIFMDFRSVLRQAPDVALLLPPEIKGRTCVGPAFDYIYEPSREMILKELLPRYIKTELYRLIFEAYTSEQAGRMNFMENATKNAGDVIEHLTLVGNQVRQSAITREILEVVSGAEALA
mgnify:CR=1 FL=1